MEQSKIGTDKDITNMSIYNWIYWFLTISVPVFFTRLSQISIGADLDKTDRSINK
jgi:hypothetical protein